MSRDRPASEHRREVAQAEERNRPTRESADQASGPDFVPFGWPSLPGRGRSPDSPKRGPAAESTGATTQAAHERERGQGQGHRGDDTRVDERVIGLLILAGVALFLFPEPLTSAIGIALVVAGVVAWIVELAT